MLQVISGVFIVMGGLIFCIAGLGLLRLPDMFTRISAIGTAAGLGTVMIVVGVVLQDLTVPNLIKAALAIVLQLITSVIGATAIARAAVLGRQHFAAGTDLETVAHLGAVARATEDSDSQRGGQAR